MPAYVATSLRGDYGDMWVGIERFMREHVRRDQRVVHRVHDKGRDANPWVGIGWDRIGLDGRVIGWDGDRMGSGEIDKMGQGCLF